MRQGGCVPSAEGLPCCAIRFDQQYSDWELQHHWLTTPADHAVVTALCASVSQLELAQQLCTCSPSHSLGPKRVLSAYLCASWQPKVAEQTDRLNAHTRAAATGWSTSMPPRHCRPRVLCPPAKYRGQNGYSARGSTFRLNSRLEDCCNMPTCVIGKDSSPIPQETELPSTPTSR